MRVLVETPQGFAIFRVLNEAILANVRDLHEEFSTPDLARTMVQLVAFKRFDNTSEALSEACDIEQAVLSQSLRDFLTTHLIHGEILAVADPRLGIAIQETLMIVCEYDENGAVSELLRGIRSQLPDLISDLGPINLSHMTLGLSHTLARHKLQFDPDRADTLIAPAIALLDELDKQLNIYALRIKEWYGWHFPELSKIVSDNVKYAKSARLMGDRVRRLAAGPLDLLDFSEFLSGDEETDLKDAAAVSMGTEITEFDELRIRELCDEFISLSEERTQKFDRLQTRMDSAAPNLTALVGPLVGARLIAHGGGVMNLAKQPASTIQVFGSESTLFAALKYDRQPPKHGDLIYSASLVGRAGSERKKGKIARTLAAKCALAIRCDAYGNSGDNTKGVESFQQVEQILNNLSQPNLAPQG